MHFILLYFLIINKASLTHIAESPSKRVLAFDMEINFIRTQSLVHLHVNKTNFHTRLFETEAKGNSLLPKARRKPASLAWGKLFH